MDFPSRTSLDCGSLYAPTLRKSGKTPNRYLILSNSRLPTVSLDINALSTPHRNPLSEKHTNAQIPPSMIYIVVARFRFSRPPKPPRFSSKPECPVLLSRLRSDVYRMHLHLKPSTSPRSWKALTWRSKTLSCPRA